MTLGEKIQTLRKQKGWSQEELAEQIHVSRQALSRWEQGAATPDVSNVLELSRIFDVSTDYLLRDDYGDNMRAGVHNADNHARIRIVSGITLLCISLIGILVLCILGSVADESYIVYGLYEEVLSAYFGIPAFLINYHLIWLFVLCIVGVISGIVLIMYPKLKQWRKSRQHDWPE